MIDNLIQKIEQLPPIPNVINELQNLYFYEDYNTSDIEVILKKDPNMVANILKIANSPYYGLPREFFDIRQAITYFGLEQIIEFAMASVVDEYLQFDLSFYDIDALTFMHFSQLKAKVAKQLVEEKIDRFVVSNTAFLSDISKSLISSYAIEQGIAPITAKEPLNAIDNIERELLGFDSVEVTQKMFMYWNFDNTMTDLLEHFKNDQSPKSRALFIARDVVTIDARIDNEVLMKYPDIKEQIANII